MFVAGWKACATGKPMAAGREEITKRMKEPDPPSGSGISQQRNRWRQRTLSIGTSATRADAYEKVTGQARFAEQYGT